MALRWARHIQCPCHLEVLTLVAKRSNLSGIEKAIAEYVFAVAVSGLNTDAKDRSAFRVLGFESSGTGDKDPGGRVVEIACVVSIENISGPIRLLLGHDLLSKLNEAFEEKTPDGKPVKPGDFPECVNSSKVSQGARSCCSDVPRASRRCRKEKPPTCRP